MRCLRICLFYLELGINKFAASLQSVLIFSHYFQTLNVNSLYGFLLHLFFFFHSLNMYLSNNVYMPGIQRSKDVVPVFEVLRAQ